MNSARLRIRGAGLVLCVAAAAVSSFTAAQAATPVGGSTFVVRDHDTLAADSEGHHQGAHRHEHLYGTALGTYPDLGKATRRQRAQARRLWRRSLRAVEVRFPNYGAALSLGFRPMVEVFPRPLVLHVRHREYARDDLTFDARKPESLVYWWPAEGEPVLVAFMYRYPMGRRPAFAGRLLGWHTHGGETQMTHVWMTRSLRTALANCMPVAALESALPAFRYSTPALVGTPDAHPCPAQPPTAEHQHGRSAIE